MIECAITTKKQQTRVAQLENSTFEVDRVDKEPEELDNLAKMEQSFDLTSCEFRELPADVDYSSNEFDIELPITKVKIKFKLLTGTDERNIANELKSLKKIGQQAEVTTRLKNVITSINGDSEKSTINNFVDNMLSKESLFLREEVARISPDINLSQDVEIGGETVSLDIPMTVEFFWPKTGR